MTELCELAKKWGTDKVGNHSYTPYYHSLFEGRRAEIKKVLEIGIGNDDDMGTEYRAGASIFMWEEYFPNADIYALDILPEALINKGRIRSYQCNQGSAASLRQAMAFLGNGFDLIVDDGSHVPRHQIQTACMFIPLLSPHGIYIIEDVWQMPIVPDNIPYKSEVKEFKQGGNSDDRLLVIKADEQ